VTSVVFVGFDSMDCRLVRRWAAEGRLPAFQQLIDTWSSAPTENLRGLMVGGLWPSFWSRSHPGMHGSYSWRQLLPNTYLTDMFLPTDFDAEPFWVELDRAGIRTAILDMPLVRPTPLQHGIHAVDWGSHDSQLSTSITAGASASATLERLQALGAYPQRQCDTVVIRHGHETLVENIHEGIDLRSKALSILLDDAPDVLATVFAETHCAGHHLYHLHDAGGGRYDADLAARCGGDALLHVYEHMDRALAELLARIPGDASVMVLLSHGIGPHQYGNLLLPEILRRLADHHRPTPAWSTARERTYARAAGVRRRVQRRLGRRNRVDLKIRNIDGSAPWYPLPNNDLYGAIRVNLQGREPRGRVRRGSDYEQVLTLLSDELLALRHARSGEPAVRAVLRTDDLYPGPKRDWLPDLFVEWNWDEPFANLTSPTIGVIAGVDTPIRTGDHRLHGEVFARHLPLAATSPTPVQQLADLLVDEAYRRRSDTSPGETISAMRPAQ